AVHRPTWGWYWCLLGRLGAAVAEGHGGLMQILRPRTAAIAVERGSRRTSGADASNDGGTPPSKSCRYLAAAASALLTRRHRTALCATGPTDRHWCSTIRHRLTGASSHCATGGPPTESSRLARAWLPRTWTRAGTCQ